MAQKQDMNKGLVGGKKVKGGLRRGASKTLKPILEGGLKGGEGGYRGASSDGGCFNGGGRGPLCVFVSACLCVLLCVGGWVLCFVLFSTTSTGPPSAGPSSSGGPLKCARFRSWVVV